ARYNDFESVKNLFENNSGEIAAIIIEPIAGNMGCIVPEENFLENLRKICDENNALLIFDEVMTGFRLDFGGAQKRLNVNADLVCFGKIIGGGFPVGAFAGRSEIMDFLAPLGPVYQAGTLSGNPIAMRAGITTLSILKEDLNLYERIDATTKILHEEISSILSQKGIEHTANRLGSMISFFFGENQIKNFEDAQQANHSLFNQFFHHLLKEGIYLPPSGYETWFISDSIQNEEIDKTLSAVEKFLQ